MAVQSDPKLKNGKRQTLKLLARIGKQQVLVLVDSGSVGTFTSEELVKKLKLQTEACDSATYKAADGGQLQCSSHVPALEWWVQGLTFKSDARVLALRCYDMIVGEDWLEAVSPVWVDYLTKAMRITYQGKLTALQGVKDQLNECPQISPAKLRGLIRAGGVSCCIQLSSVPDTAVLSDDQQYI